MRVAMHAVDCPRLHTVFVCAVAEVSLATSNDASCPSVTETVLVARCTSTMSCTLTVIDHPCCCSSDALAVINTNVLVYITTAQ
jgi:hypothetical protein